MRCNWWRWLWGIVPLLVLSWVAVQAEQSRIEADLRERAKLALTQAGMSWAATRFEGRDAYTGGPGRRRCRAAAGGGPAARRLGRSRRREQS
jgi:hypothetical protein